MGEGNNKGIRGRIVAASPSRVRKALPRRVFIVSRHLIAVAAAAASVFFAIPAEAGCSKSVIMYNASWCPYCAQVRAILARNHIRYAVLDATSPQIQAIMLKRFGDTAVPRTLIGGVLVEGVDEARIKQLCR
jgi:glutaredoxin